MSKRQQNNHAYNRQLALFYQESRRAFGEQYKVTRKPSVLIAQNMIEDAVEKGTVSVTEATAFFRNPADFANLLLEAETEYQNSEDQKIHDRMFNLERNTDWKAAAAVSLGAGMVTGLVFAVVSPFVSTWLQPTADALFKRNQTTSVAATTAVPTITNVTNIANNNYFSAPESKQQSTKTEGKISCKNMSVGSYPATLLELLQQGNVVTLEVNGKKAILCYRPNLQVTTQPRALAK